MITIKSDNSIEIEGCLIISPDEPQIFVEPDSHWTGKICNNIFYSTSPKVWQVGKWLALIKLIRKFTLREAR